MIRTIANIGVLQFFSALLLIVFVMFASNYFMLRNSISEIYGHVGEKNKLVAEGIIQSFDASFKEINNLVYAMNMLPYETLEPKEPSASDLLNSYLMQKQIAQLVSSASLSYVDGVFAFFAGSDKAITSEGTIKLSELFKNKYRHPTYNADYWKAFASTKHSFRIFPETEYVETTTYNEKRKKLLVVLGNNNMSNKNVVVMVDAEKLLQEVLKTLRLEISLMVFDENRNLVLSTDPNMDLVEISKDVYPSDGREAEVSKKQYDYYIKKSDYNGYVYINKTPAELRGAGSATEKNRWIMLITVFSVVLLAAALSVYLFKPMRGLYTLLDGSSSKMAGYRHLRSQIIRLRDENEAYQSNIHLVQSDARRRVFIDALDPFLHSREAEGKIQQYFADFLQFNGFIMAAFQFKTAGDREDPSLIKIEEWHTQLEGELQAVFGTTLLLHSGKLQFVALIETNAKTDRSKTVQSLRKFVLNCKIGEGEGYSIAAIVSRMYTPESNHISQAYRDVNHGLSCRNMDEDGSVIDVEAISPSWRVSFPLEEMEKLSNCLTNGNAQEAVQIIHIVLKDNVEHHIQYHQLVSLSKNIFYYMIRLLELDEREQGEIANLESAFCCKLENVWHYREIVDMLSQVVHYVSDYFTNLQKSKLNPGYISQYISLHYMENLYQDHMADIFETTPKYFSNYFKKAFGVNYVDYLNRVRLMHAKELLKNTDLTAAEIGKKVGYINSTTFSSTFKKYFGISPGEYRKKIE